MMDTLSLPVIERIRQCTAWDDGQLYGVFEGVTIRSAFQPIYSAQQGDMVGVEGLMRCTGRQGDALSPLELLDNPGRSERDSVFLDRLCRYLHVGNHRRHAPQANWLFLNVSARTIVAGRRYGAYFSDLLRELDFPPQRVVVEILEDDILDETLLSAAVEYYRDLGCIIAIDDFGAGNSNFGRLWEIEPDIVKLDRSLLVRAGIDERTRKALPKLVDVLHESGCQVIMEGIETEAEALIAWQSGADMVQGYYFARPEPVISSAMMTTSGIDRIRQLYGTVS